MSDTNPNQFVIDGAKYDIFLACIKYIYCDELPIILDENVHDLFHTAGKLGLSRIIALCEKYLAPTVTLDNAITMFKLGFKAKANQLKAVALDLIVYNFDLVKKKPEFTNLEQEEYLEVTFAAMNQLALKRKFMETQ